MSAITKPTQAALDQLRQQQHPRCVICGRDCDHGLDLRFSVAEDGGVEATFDCRAVMQGYIGMLHGGITSALLDGAMTNCLFAHNVVAVTGEMRVRYRKPIELDEPLMVSARLERSQSPLFVVEATIRQSEEVKATSVGKFMQVQNTGVTLSEEPAKS